MKKLNLIILAGGEKGPLYDAYGCDNKALLNIHGKAMLDWVIEAFQETGCIDKIVVVGSEELDALPAMRFVDKRIESKSNFGFNVLRGIAYMRWKYYRHESNHVGYIISFCDAVFLTPDAIADAVITLETTPMIWFCTMLKKKLMKKIISKLTGRISQLKASITPEQQFTT